MPAQSGAMRVGPADPDQQPDGAGKKRAGESTAAIGGDTVSPLSTRLARSGVSAEEQVELQQYIDEQIRLRAAAALDSVQQEWRTRRDAEDRKREQEWDAIDRAHKARYSSLVHRLHEDGPGTLRASLSPSPQQLPAETATGQPGVALRLRTA